MLSLSSLLLSLVGQRFGMTVEEFGHFLHFSKLYDWKENLDLIGKCYQPCFFNHLYVLFRGNDL
jgi:hypothetical protein